MQASALKGPWPTRERILVCINRSPLAKSLVRAGKRMAERAGVGWIVATVVTARHEALPDTARRLTTEAYACRNAWRRGCNAACRSRRGVRAHQFCPHPQCIAAADRPSPRPLALGLLREPVADQLLDAATDFEVTIVAGEGNRSRASVLPRIDLAISWQSLLAGSIRGGHRHPDRPAH